MHKITFLPDPNHPINYKLKKILSLQIQLNSRLFILSKSNRKIHYDLLTEYHTLISDAITDFRIMFPIFKDAEIRVIFTTNNKQDLPVFEISLPYKEL